MGSDQVSETDYWKSYAMIPGEAGKQRVVIRKAIHKVAPPSKHKEKEGLCP